MPANAMLTNLKNVSESIIGLLTLLLQVLVHQLETQPVIEDENDQDPSMNSSELNQTMTNMLQELQNQRTGDWWLLKHCRVPALRQGAEPLKP